MIPTCTNFAVSLGFSKLGFELFRFGWSQVATYSERKLISAHFGKSVEVQIASFSRSRYVLEGSPTTTQLNNSTSGECKDARFPRRNNRTELKRVLFGCANVNVFARYLSQSHVTPNSTALQSCPQSAQVHFLVSLYLKESSRKTFESNIWNHLRWLAIACSKKHLCKFRETVVADLMARWKKATQKYDHWISLRGK